MGGREGCRLGTHANVFNDLMIIQPWPIVERFLKEQKDGAIGADVGCGNGKYLAVNPRVFIVGSDRYVLMFPILYLIPCIYLYIFLFIGLRCVVFRLMRIGTR